MKRSSARLLTQLSILDSRSVFPEFSTIYVYLNEWYLQNEFKPRILQMSHYHTKDRS